MSNVLTVIFTHYPYEQVEKIYNWHKDKVSNLRIIWRIGDFEPEEIIKNNNPHIMPMKLPMLKSKNFTQIIPNCLTWFQDKSWDYYIVMEGDALILSDEFEKNCIEHMQENQVSVLLPWLRSGRLNPEHPFGRSLASLQAKFWSIPAISILSKDALNYYGQCMMHVPNYWHEVRFPTALIQGDFHVSFNPFLKEESFHAPDNRTESLVKEVIEKAIKEDGVLALHAIKEPEWMDYVQEVWDEKNGSKKADSK